VTQDISSSVDAVALPQHVACSTLLLPSLKRVSLSIIQLLFYKRVRQDTQTPTAPINELDCLLSAEQAYKQCLICLLDLCRHLHIMLVFFSSKDRFGDSNRPTSLCFRITYLLTPCSRVLLEKLTGLQLVKNFPAYYGTRRFITVFRSVRHLSLS
jgi:hypothetical protein